MGENLKICPFVSTRAQKALPTANLAAYKKENHPMERRDKYNYYLDIAQTVAARGTCLRRNFGAIIVKNDQIISTGYVGAPRGR